MNALSAKDMLCPSCQAHLLKLEHSIHACHFPLGGQRPVAIKRLGLSHYKVEKLIEILSFNVALAKYAPHQG